MLLTFLFISCEKEYGELFNDSASIPTYSHEILEKVWETEIEFLSELSETVFQYTLISVSVEDLIFSASQIQFLNKSFSYDQGEKLILAASKGQIFCLKLPL